MDSTGGERECMAVHLKITDTLANYLFSNMLVYRVCVVHRSDIVRAHPFWLEVIHYIHSVNFRFVFAALVSV